MISTFLKTLGPTYQLMLLTACTDNFADVINKATHVQVAIKASLVTEAATILLNANGVIPRKATVA